MRGVVASGLVCLSVCDAFGAVSHYLRTETANYNGYDGATLVTWTKTSSPKGRAWAVKFDLTKGFRMRACYGDGSGSRATVGAMAARLFTEGQVPIVGINADYFMTDRTASAPGGFTIEDCRMTYGGYINATYRHNYIMELPDHTIVHGKPKKISPGTENPSASWEMRTADGHRIRNAVRTCKWNYPVKDGEIYDIGHEQPRDTYPRTLIGIGTNALGHAQLVLFLNDGRQSSWSSGVSDVDSAQMMIDEGCVEVGEFDGGGSATMWSIAGADSVYPGSRTTAHGGYINKPSDGSPREVANAVFVTAPRSCMPEAFIDDDVFDTFAEAMLARAPGEMVSLCAKGDKPHGRIRFFADYEEGCVTNAVWKVAPVDSGVGYTADYSSWANLEATRAQRFPAKVEQDVTVAEGCTDADLAQFLLGWSEPPKAALAVVENEPAVFGWRGLAKQDGAAAWIELFGVKVGVGDVYRLTEELKIVDGVLRVSYLVKRSDGTVRLRSADGAGWFDSAAPDGSSFRNVEFVSRGEMTEILALGMDAGFAVRMR